MVACSDVLAFVRFPDKSVGRTVRIEPVTRHRSARIDAERFGKNRAGRIELRVVAGCRPIKPVDDAVRVGVQAGDVAGIVYCQRLGSVAVGLASLGILEADLLHFRAHEETPHHSVLIHVKAGQPVAVVEAAEKREDCLRRRDDRNLSCRASHVPACDSIRGSVVSSRRPTIVEADDAHGAR